VVLELVPSYGFIDSVLSKNCFSSLLKGQQPSYGSLNSWLKFSGTLLQDTNTAVSLRLSWQRIRLMKFKGSYPIPAAYIWLLCGFWTGLRQGWFELKTEGLERFLEKLIFPELIKASLLRKSKSHCSVYKSRPLFIIFSAANKM